MSGDPTPPVQTTTQVMSPQQQALFNAAYPGVANFAANPPKRYPGETVEPFTPTQESAQSQILGGAGTTQQIADWAKQGAEAIPASLTGDLASTTPFVRTPLTTSSDIFNDPGIWNPEFNTGLNEAILAAQRPLYQQLTETALPAIRGTALAAGPGGSSREGIAEGLATGRTTQAAADVARKMAEDEYAANLAAVQARYGTNLAATGQRYGTDVGAETARYGTDVGAENQRYAANINARLAALGMAPSLQQQQLVPGFTTGAVGDVQQALKQAVLTGKINAWNYDQMAPFLASSDVMSLLQGMPGGTTVSTGNVPRPAVGPQMAGGALTGAAIGATVGGLPGAGIGALGGATLPFLFRNV